LADQLPEVQFIRQSSKRRKKDHGGQWKIAYADFVTAMMVFFLIMWIVSMIPQIQKDNIADYFKGKSTKESKDSKTNKEGADLPKTKAEMTPEDILEDAKKYVERLKELRKEIETFISENQALMKDTNELLIEETAEGLTITLAENKRPMFLLGGANIEATTAQVLQRLGKPLSSSRFQIKVEGHTDSSGYRPGALYSNWELSADRANAARRELLAGGLSEDKIAEVTGYADRLLFVKDDPRSPLNRRITITAFTPKDQLKVTEEVLTPQEVAAADKAAKAGAKAGAKAAAQEKDPKAKPAATQQKQ
jgi:chemotaxis protein MotB